MQNLLKKLNKINVKLNLSTEDKLDIQAPKGVMNKQLLEEIKLNKEELIKFIKESKIANIVYQEIPLSKEDENYELSPFQYRLWLYIKINDKSSYNINGEYYFKYKFNLSKLKSSINKVIERHEILRTIFLEVDGFPKQKILKLEEINFEINVLQKNIENSISINKYIQEDSEVNINIEKFPLFKIFAIVDDLGFKICFVIHHIICDAWSLDNLSSEIFEIYHSEGEEIFNNLPNLTIQYKDYTNWLNRNIKKDFFSTELDYWRSKLVNYNYYTTLPYDKSIKLDIGTRTSKYYEINLEEDFKHKIDLFIIENKVSLISFFISCFKLLIHRITQIDDVIIGLPVANRNHDQLKNMIGYFVNVIMHRDRINEEEQYLAFLNRVNDTLLEGINNQGLPFDVLLEKINLKKEINKFPLTSVFINGLNFNDNIKTDEISNESNHGDTNEDSKFDIELYIKNFKNGILLNCVYNSSLFEQKTIEFWIGGLLSIIEEALIKPGTTIRDFTIFDTPMVIDSYPTPEIEFEKWELQDLKGTIINRFDYVVKKYPNNNAIIQGDSKISYNELDKITNGIANIIKLKSKQQQSVLLFLDHGILAIYGLIGTLKAECSYVPIDVNLPIERIKNSVEGVDFEVILCSNRTQKLVKEIFIYNKNNLKFINIENIQPDVNLFENLSHPDDIAYILFTSGSTGIPKGVIQNHRNVLHFINVYTNKLHLNIHDKLSLLPYYNFDSSVMDIFGALLNGATLFPYDVNVSGIESLGYWLKNNEISVFHSVPTIYRYFVTSLNNIDFFEHIRLVVLGGEAVFREDFNYFKKHFEKKAIFINGYGPTESTITLQNLLNHNSIINSNKICIGYPVEDTEVFLMKSNGRKARLYEEGEIVYKSKYLALGYFKNEENTNSKFVVDPFTKEGRVYFSGDIGKYLISGELEFLGRNDNQIKYNGIRIELDEIDHQLMKLDEVCEAVTILDQMKIVSYVKLKTNINKSVLIQKLKLLLPAYMIPSALVYLEIFPLTNTGKIERNSLPKVSEIDIIRNEYIAPRNETEEIVASIWQEVLGQEVIGITDNFFELGGHSLVVTQIINRIQKQLNKIISIKVFFDNPTIETLSNHLQTKTYISIPNVAESESYKLTSSQKRIWMLSQLNNGSVAYNMPTVIKLLGTLNIIKFEESFVRLITRHEILRTNFKVDNDGEVSQFILPIDQIDFKIEQKDFTLDHNPDCSVFNYLKEKNNIPFTLEHGALLTSSLIKLDQNEFVFFFSMHHIIGDGWSSDLLVSEVVKIYNGLIQGIEIELPILKIQYKDYAAWQSLELLKDENQKAKEFWLRQFEGEVSVLELPSFRKRPLVQTYNGESISHSYSQDFLIKLKVFSNTNEVTLFMTLLTGIKILLYRYSSQEDIIIGTPIAGRDHPDLENQIGLYINTLAIRTRFQENDTFLDVLNREKKTLLGAYEYQNYPFDELVNNLNLKRDLSRSALFDIMVVLQNQAQTKMPNSSIENNISGVEIEEYVFSTKTSQFDLSFNFFENDSLILKIEYNTDIYDRFLIERMFLHLENLMTKLIANPIQLIEDLDYLTLEEKNRLLVNFNDTKSDYPKDKTVIDLFEDQVEKTPNEVAIVFEEKKITYKELNEQVNQLAFYLRKKYTIKPDDLVGIKLDRSELIIVAVLAVLKAGGAYVPIDIDYPQDRIDYIEKDSNCKVIVDEEEIELFYEVQHQFSVSNIEKNICSDNLIYIIYTSGTSGNPKGVMVEHCNFNARLNYYKDFYKLEDSKEVFLFYRSYCFDGAIEEYLLPFSVGAKVIITNSNFKMNIINNIFDFINKYKITKINMPPILLKEFVNDIGGEDKIYKIKTLKHIVSGGDVLNLDVIKDIGQKLNINFYNSYGPTENTIDSTNFKIDFNHEGKNSIIGIPVLNSQVYILNKKLIPVPIGVAGQLYVAGDGVTRGYLNKPELTREKFIENPFEKGTRMYDTGDLGSWLPDGNIEFLGRNDHQVKIRGYRIELGEIETTLTKYSQEIQQIIVVAKEINNDKTLVAYYVSKTSIDKSAIRDYLQKQLPDYMVPSFYVELEVLPLTPNGKIDRKALPSITGEELIQREYVEPRNDIEKKLVAIWQEVLGIEKIGIVDNFFELGGNSIKLIKLINRYNNLFDLDIKLSNFLEKNTITDQIQYVNDNKNRGLKNSFVDISSDVFYATLEQKRFLKKYKDLSKEKKDLISGMYLFEGEINIDKVLNSLKKLISENHALHSKFILKGEEVLVHFDNNNEDKYIYRTENEINVQGIFTNEINKGIDLLNGPLSKFYFFEISKKQYYFGYIVHHTVFDAFSEIIMINNLINNYLGIDYKVGNYKKYLLTNNTKDWDSRSVNYLNIWREILKYNKLNIFEIKKGKSISNENMRYKIVFNEDEKNIILSFCKKTNISLTSFFMNIYGNIYKKYFGQNNFSINISSNNRTGINETNVIGLIRNSVIMNLDCNTILNENSFIETNKMFLSFLDYQDIPVSIILNKFNCLEKVLQSVSFVNLYNTVIDEKELNIPFKVSNINLNKEGEHKTDLTFYFHNDEGKMALNCVYNSEIYNKQSLFDFEDNLKSTINNL